MILNRDDYRSKVLGCWMGKNIGGTIGAPFEWRRQVNDVSFYTQELGGNPLPNDDLDIQLLWLVALEERGIALDAHTLAEYWCLYVTPHWVEYGTAKINMRAGLPPPLSGNRHNPYKHSCGAFIRCEIWACICPGNPQLAARYAYEDAILDHGNGEGTYAEVFTATLESAAFVVDDLRKLIDIGLSYIPSDCAVAKAVHLAIECFDRKKTWLEARNIILEKHRGKLAWPENTSEDDRKRGFDSGEIGYDVPSNIGMLVVGLLYGEGDFAKTICTAVNCGEDTDCTGATAGSIFGIMRGIDAIPRKWIDPIGRSIKTITLDLGDLAGQVAKDVDDLSARTEGVARQVLLENRRAGVRFSDTAGPGEKAGKIDPASLMAKDSGAFLFGSLSGPRYRFLFFEATLDYGDEPVIKDGVEKRIRLSISNTYRIQANMTIEWLAPETWRVTPSRRGSALVMPPWFGPDSKTVVDFGVTIDAVPSTINRASIQITIEGRPTVMAVPVTLLNGNLLAGGK
jgi:ADP-ribosylglycohydrolase